MSAEVKRCQRWALIKEENPGGADALPGFSFCASVFLKPGAA